MQGSILRVHYYSCSSSVLLYSTFYFSSLSLLYALHILLSDVYSEYVLFTFFNKIHGPKIEQW